MQIHPAAGFTQSPQLLVSGRKTPWGFRHLHYTQVSEPWSHTSGQHFVSLTRLSSHWHHRHNPTPADGTQVHSVQPLHLLAPQTDPPTHGPTPASGIQAPTHTHVHRVRVPHSGNVLQRNLIR